jgi:hypothetical protein
MTEADATVVASVVTTIGTLAAVFVGWWLLRGKVRGLEEALDASKASIDQHALDVNTMLSRIRDDVAEQISPVVESIGKLRADAEEPEPKPAGGRRDRLWKAWIKVRDKVEQSAAQPHIDGRTRAAYARIDKRQYYRLIDALAERNHLIGNSERYRDALDLWMRFRSNRAQPTEAEVNRLEQIAEELAGALAR